MYVMSRHKILIADFADFIFLYTNIFFICIILVCVNVFHMTLLQYYLTTGLLNVLQQRMVLDQ